MTRFDEMPRAKALSKTVYEKTKESAFNLVGGFPLWLLLLLFRMINGALLQTYFDPDEHWQSLEVAHYHVFGYGWLTWEWRVGLRSYLYVLPFASYFWLLKVLGLDHHDWLITAGPRVFVQALIAASIDYLVYTVAFRLFRQRGVAESAVHKD